MSSIEALQKSNPIHNMSRLQKYLAIAISVFIAESLAFGTFMIQKVDVANTAYLGFQVIVMHSVTFALYVALYSRMKRLYQQWPALETDGIT